ncbi:uncharacterized protein LOC132720653 [Ruditapes philippinarum]|uniref:uncharacterized protein LOC132720653 n=1 Tax=Ruditapes philippinarum TaxID=129788 RepID=UPI00295B3555|nr:uncharacterized protein LOC132720653 [Ruditapes philippinarum]
MSDRYYRLVTFVINICPKPLRGLFISKAKQDKNTQYTTLKDYLVFRKQDIDTLKSRNKISTDQCDHIFPSDGIVDIQTWDITLLSALLRGLFKTELDCSEIRCIDEITTTRNDLQHISGTECIEAEQFDLLWENLKRAVLKLAECAGAPEKSSIEEEIKKSLTENMPNLGDVLRTWHKVLYIQLSLQNKKLEEELKKQSSKIRNVGATSAKSKTILLKASRKTQGRSV